MKNAMERHGSQGRVKRLSSLENIYNFLITIITMQKKYCMRKLVFVKIIFYAFF